MFSLADDDLKKKSIYMCLFLHVLIQHFMEIYKLEKKHNEVLIYEEVNQWGE